MTISWDSVRASDEFFVEQRDRLEADMAVLGRQSEWTRLLALPVGVSCFILAVAKAVSHIGEAIFKGLVNLFAWPFSDEFKFKRAFMFMGGETLYGLVILIAAVGEGALFTLATALNAF